MAIGKLNSYLTWRETIVLSHPTIIYLPYTAPMPEINDWLKIVNIDCQWHISRYNIFDFQIGYDFFFRILKDAALFRLTWGGTVENEPPDQFQLYFFD